MSKKILFLTIIVLAAIAGYSYYSSTKPVSTNMVDMSQSNTSSEPTPSTFTSTTTTTQSSTGAIHSTTTTTTVTPINTTAPKTYQVSIQGFTFSPQIIQIKAGDTIVWTNLDNVPHRVLSDTGSELNSTNLENNQTYSHTFTNAGTFDYHCAVHPGMKATVIVR